MKSHFITMIWLASLGFEVVPGRVVSSNGRWFEYQFGSDAVTLRRADGEELTIPYEEILRSTSK